GALCANGMAEAGEHTHPGLAARYPEHDELTAVRPVVQACALAYRGNRLLDWFERLGLNETGRGRRDGARESMRGAGANRIRVYLIDDHPIVREGFVRTLADEPDIEVVGHSGTAAEALTDTLALRPNVVLVDLSIPDRDGIELLAALRAQLPSSKLLVLSSY